MGVNVLFTRSAGQEIQADDPNQYFLSESGDKVPRSSGVPSDGAGSLGSPIYQWQNFYFNGSLIANGSAIDVSKLATVKNQIKTGYSFSDGYPRYLSTVAVSLDIKIDTNSTANPLSVIIEGSGVTVSADITISSITAAPSTNNTCAVNMPNYADQEYTKLIGEKEFGVGYNAFGIDAVGSEITSLDGTIQVFSKGSEYFIAYVDTTAGLLYPIKRGVARTTRETLLDNDVITLLRATYVFLDSNGSLIYKTTVFPSSAPSDPASGTTGEFYFNTSTGSWKRYNGASWESTDSVWLGYGIADDTVSVGVETIDYNLGWDSLLRVDFKQTGDLKVVVNLTAANVAGQIYEKSNDFGIEIDLSDAGDRDSGVSQTVSTQYYVYLTQDFDILFSDIAPRPLDWRNGYYHPLKYYRCIGKTYNNASNRLEVIKFLDNNATFGGIIDYADGYKKGGVPSNNSGTPLTTIDISAFKARGFLDGYNILSTDVLVINTTDDMLGGALAVDTTYHIKIGIKPEGIVVGFDDGTAESLPTGWLDFKRVGSVITDASSNIISGKWSELSSGGVAFEYDQAISDSTSTSTSITSIEYTISIPTGLNLIAKNVIYVSRDAERFAFFAGSTDNLPSGTPDANYCNIVSDTGSSRSVQTFNTISTNEKVYIKTNTAAGWDDFSLMTQGYQDERIT